MAELEDRLAPDLGLDDNGSLLLDFGPRQFTVSFDETLKPFVRDASGSRLKDLPKPNKSDDESQANNAVNRYKLLKDARTVAAQQVAKAESAMCPGAVAGHRKTSALPRVGVIRWSATNPPSDFGAFIAENQLLVCFRVAEDNSYSTADDDLSPAGRRYLYWYSSRSGNITDGCCRLRSFCRLRTVTTVPPASNQSATR